NEKWSSTGKPIVDSSYSDTLGVPALFDHSCFEELLELGGDTGAKPIILADQNRVAEVPFEEGVWDVDRPEDYQRVNQIARAAASQPPNKPAGGLEAADP